MSTFIMESDNLNGEDIEAALSLEKSDTIIFYSKTGKISIDLHELLVSLKAKYEFFELPNDDIDIESYCIMLGLLANSVTDNLILIYPPESSINKLNSREFPGPKGNFKIVVCSDFKTAMKLCKTVKSKKQEPVKKARKPRDKKESNLSNENEPLEELSMETDEIDNESSSEYDDTEGILHFKKTSDAFITLLQNLETDDVPLVSRADAIADAIVCSDGADLALPMQLRMKCQCQDEDQIFDLLLNHLQELKKIAYA